MQLRQVEKDLVRARWLRQEDMGSHHARWMVPLTDGRSPLSAFFDHPSVLAQCGRPGDLLALSSAVRRAGELGGCGKDILEEFLAHGAPLRALSLFSNLDTFPVRHCLPLVRELKKREVLPPGFAEVFEALCRDKFGLEDVDASGKMKNPANLAAVSWWKKWHRSVSQPFNAASVTENKINVLYRLCESFEVPLDLGAMLAFGGLSHDELILLAVGVRSRKKWAACYQDRFDAAHAALVGTSVKRLEAIASSDQGSPLVPPPHERSHMALCDTPGERLSRWLSATGRAFFPVNYRVKEPTVIQLTPAESAIPHDKPETAFWMKRIFLAEAVGSIEGAALMVHCLQRDPWHMINDSNLKKRFESCLIVGLDILAREAEKRGLEKLYVPTAHDVLMGCLLPPNPNKIASDYGIFLSQCGFELESCGDGRIVWTLNLHPSS